MKRRIRRGFTLVELLVVISIIGMLAALILPAVNSAREAARRNTCMSNMRQVGMAVIGHETNKGHYPGYKNVQARRTFDITTDASSGKFVLGTALPAPGYHDQATSWVFPLLGFMERNDIVQSYGDGGTDAAGFLKGVTPDLSLNVMICPSDVQAGQEGRGASSFVANAGMADFHNTTAGSEMVLNVADGHSPDYPQNGVFQNAYPFKSSDNLGSSFGDPIKVVKTSSSAINDGVSTTLMLSENADGGLWHDPEEYLNSFIWQPGLVSGNFSFTSPNLENVTFHQHDILGHGVFRINEEGGNSGAFGSTYSPYTFARPSSYHPGGVNVVFCDGHAQFIQEGISPEVWAQIMSPYGARAGIPRADGISLLSADGDFEIYARHVLDEDALSN